MCRARAVLRQGLNTTEVHWDGTQAAPYFNYRTDDGSIHQVRALPVRCAVQCVCLHALARNACSTCARAVERTRRASGVV